MKKLLCSFIMILLLCSIGYTQERVISKTKEGRSESITFFLQENVTRYVYVAFDPAEGDPIPMSMSSLTPAPNWLESGNWFLAVKVDTVNAVAISNLGIWMKPMMDDGIASQNDSTFLKFDSVNPSSSTATSIDVFAPIPSNRLKNNITEAWYTCSLPGTIWGYAGTIFGFSVTDVGSGINLTFKLYRYK